MAESWRRKHGWREAIRPQLKNGAKLISKSSAAHQLSLMAAGLASVALKAGVIGMAAWRQ